MQYQKLVRHTAVVAAIASSLLGTLSLQAAPIQGSAGMSFYNALSTQGASGDLLSYRNATLNLGAQAPAHQAWNVMYQSSNSKGVANAVTGTVIVPSAAWTGSGTRPMLAYAVGTHGLAQNCAPSLQMAQGSDYETANIVAALKAGYAVVISDYAGYTNNATPTYLAGASQGHAVLDILRAATQIPNVGLSTSTKSVIWGFSQGGQSAAWAAELQPSYAPELKLKGVAAGGIPGDFIRTGAYLDGSTGASFLFGGVIGLAEEYPEGIPLNTLANAQGQAAVTRGKSQCVFESLFELMNDPLSKYTVGNQPYSQLINLPSVNQTLLAQNLGSKRIEVPLYQYHGTADEFIPIDQAVALKKQYCNKFSNVTFDVYPGEHIATQFQAAPYALAWLNDRVDGKIALGTCLTLAAEPKSNANPGGGDFIVSLNEWKLNAKVDLKTLKQTMVLPETSTFTGDTNITGKRLSGALSVPEFTTTLKILGVNTKVTLAIEPVGLTTGSASLNNSGILSVNGMTKVNITIKKLAGISVGSCKTSAPVEFPLSFTGPVSSLGNGNLTFTGTTTFPSIEGCSVSAILSAFMSGSGQNYSFTIEPPAPKRY